MAATAPTGRDSRDGGWSCGRYFLPLVDQVHAGSARGIFVEAVVPWHVGKRGRAFA